MDVLRHLTKRHWAWVHFKAAVLAWVVLLLCYTPVQVYKTLGAVVILVATVTIAGTLTSVVGLVMSAQAQAKVALIGITVEFAGLCLMTAGPLAYFFTQLYLAFNLRDGSQRYALCALAYVVIAAVACRIGIVAPRMWNEAHDETKPL